MKTRETQSRRSVQRIVMCVRHRTGWCALRDQRRTAYRDSMETKCGYVVTLPWGIERREPDCADCKKAHNTVLADKKSVLPNNEKQV